MNAHAQTFVSCNNINWFMCARLLMPRQVNLVVHRTQDVRLPHWQSLCVNKLRTISFMSSFGFTLCGCGEDGKQVKLRRRREPPPPNRRHPEFKKCLSLYSSVCVCVTRGTFCLARSSIPSRRDEDKGTQEEVEQKLMSVSAVQCVSSWLGEPMNKSKFLSLSFSSPVFSLSPSLSL